MRSSRDGGSSMATPVQRTCPALKRLRGGWKLLRLHSSIFSAKRRLDGGTDGGGGELGVEEMTQRTLEGLAAAGVVRVPALGRANAHGR